MVRLPPWLHRVLGRAGARSPPACAAPGPVCSLWLFQGFPPFSQGRELLFHLLPPSGIGGCPRSQGICMTGSGCGSAGQDLFCQVPCPGLQLPRPLLPLTNQAGTRLPLLRPQGLCWPEAPVRRVVSAGPGQLLPSLQLPAQLQGQEVAFPVPDMCRCQAVTATPAWPHAWHCRPLLQLESRWDAPAQPNKHPNKHTSKHPQNTLNTLTNTPK